MPAHGLQHTRLGQLQSDLLHIFLGDVLPGGNILQGNKSLILMLGNVALAFGPWFVRLTDSRGGREPMDVLAELLQASGLDPTRLPPELDARAALLRTRLAGRRVLIVLDDATDAAQVRLLLPGTAGPAVIAPDRPPGSAGPAHPPDARRIRPRC